MIEKIVLEYIQQHTTVPVYLEKPPKPPAKMIIVEKTGSSLSNRIDGATIAIQSYGGSLVQTIELNETVKQIMEGIESLDDIGGCRLNSDYNYTDTTTKQHRYQAVFSISYYGG